ncbi:MAG: hypothetical protein ACPGSC_15300 [Granulosicoccaceae bacterium]
MEPSSVFALLMPMMTLSAAPNIALAEQEIDPVEFGRIVEVITRRGRVDQLHANRLRLSDNVSLGGVFNFFDAREDQTYTLNIRITF